MDEFENIVLRFEKLVYSVCFRVTGNEADACDFTQEAFFRLFKALKSRPTMFKNDAAIRGWLCRVASNRCLDELRRRKGRDGGARFESLDECPPLGEDARELADGSASPERALVIKERIGDIQAAIDSLPLVSRTVLVLRDCAGLSYEEVAKIAAVPVGTVKSRINRARSSLRDILLKRGDESDWH